MKNINVRDLNANNEFAITLKSLLHEHYNKSIDDSESMQLWLNNINTNLPEPEKFLLLSICMHWDVFKNHIRFLSDKVYGTKHTRFFAIKLLRDVINWCLSSEVPISVEYMVSGGRAMYGINTFGQWVEYVLGILDFQLGEPERYFNAYNNLVKIFTSRPKNMQIH